MRMALRVRRAGSAIARVPVRPRLQRELATAAAPKSGPAAATTAAAPNLQTELKNALTYCVDYVKKYDSDHFVTTLLLPERARAAVFAVRAFNVECALIPERARDARMAQLRMSWWRNTVADAAAATGGAAAAALHTPKQPVAQALAIAIRRHGLSPRYFQRLLDSREAVVTSGGDQFESLESVGRYAEHSSSSVLYLTLEAMGVRYPDDSERAPTDAETAAVQAAGHVGKAVGLCTVLRGLPYHMTSTGAVLLPKTITDQHKLDVTALRTALRTAVEAAAAKSAPPPQSPLPQAQAQAADAAANAGRPAPPTPAPAAVPQSAVSAVVAEYAAPLTACVFDLACEAKAQLHAARQLRSALPAGAAAALLPAVGADRYLEALQRVGFDVWHPRVATTASRGVLEPLLFRTSLAAHKFRGTY